MKSKIIVCAICGDRIDRGDCQIRFGVFTKYDNKPIPRKVERVYLCGLHTIGVEAGIGNSILKIEGLK